MKHFIITLLSAMALSVSGFAFAGGEVVDAPVVKENPAEQKAPVVEEEVVKTPECDTTQAQCAPADTTEVSETTEEMEEVTEEISAS
jgi:hypothetical protein